VDEPIWRRIDVDGETYNWTVYPSEQRVGDGPWMPIEYLNVSRMPNTAGIGAGYPPGTVVTEHQVMELVRLAKAEGLELA
jgi:hypothetical protein